MSSCFRALAPALSLAAGSANAAGELRDRDGEASAEDRSPWSLFPIVGYSPETSALLGAGVVHTFEADRRTGHVPREPRQPRRSSLAVASAYTLNAQFFVSVAPSIYWQAEAWHAQGELSAKHFPSTFYPLGNDAPEQGAEDYTEFGLTAAGGVTRRLVASLRSGAQVGAFHSELTETEPGRELERDRVSGSDGALLLGFGPILSWDDRDNDFATQSGGRYALSAAYFGSTWGSQFEFSKYEFNARQFFGLGGEHTVGFELYAVANIGNVPFQAMAALGGSNRMRGYFEGRFRDLHMLTMQIEYRLPVFWRFGAAAFASAGDVSHELDGFRLDELKLAGGAGLRFALNQADRVNIRLDAAGTSHGDLNFYVAFGEAF